MSLQCIFYTEFHVTRGPRLVTQHPLAFLKDDFFENFSEYFITKPQLFDHLVILTVGGRKIIGYPINITNAKYERNALLFNLAFVFPRDSDLSPYKPVLRKAAAMLRTLEIEKEFISSKVTKPEDRLQPLLQKIFDGLNMRGECSIPIDDANTLHLKLLVPLHDPQVIHDYEVPTLVSDVRDDVGVRDWDLTIQQILPFIDGMTHVARIASDSNVHVDLVRDCVQHLVYYGYVKMIDVFQYGNCYSTTQKINVILDKPEVQDNCRVFITRHDMDPPPFRLVVELYAALQPNVPVRDFCLAHADKMAAIDERRFIAFGVVNEIIRRVHRYAVKSAAEEQTFAGLTEAQVTTLLPLLDGTHPFDEICLAVSKSAADMEMILRHAHCTIISR